MVSSGGDLTAEFRVQSAATYSPSAADTDFTVDASTYNIASIVFNGTTTTRTINISNMTQGRFLHLFVTKQDANAKTFNIAVSTTASGHSTANLYLTKKGTANGAVRSDGASVASLAASNGFVYMFICNISGSLPAFAMSQ
jgi:hypothetical protein